MFKDPFHWFPNPYLSTIFAVFVFGTYLSITIEEKVLIAAFGDEYRDYMKSTWKLFPGW